MISSCPENHAASHVIASALNGYKSAITQTGDAIRLQPITVREMCEQAPHAFCVNRPAATPSQTLEQWAASQGIVHVAPPVTAEPITPRQVKRRQFNAHMRISA